MKAASTKRYYLTSEEMEKALELDGKIETIHHVTPYEHDQDIELKDVDFVITTVIEIEDLDEDEAKKKKDMKRTNEFDRHLFS